MIMLQLNKLFPRIVKNSKRQKNRGNNGYNSRSGRNIKYPNYLKQYPKYGFKSLQQIKNNKIPHITFSDVIRRLIKLNEMGTPHKDLSNTFFKEQFRVSNFKLIGGGSCILPDNLEINSIQCNKISNNLSQYLTSKNIKVNIIKNE